METLNSAVQTLAIVLAGAWGVYTFVYEAKIAPGLAPPSVSVTSALERVGQRGDLVAIRSTVTRTNVGQAEVRVLGLTYNVVGVRDALRRCAPRRRDARGASHVEHDRPGRLLRRARGRRGDPALRRAVRRRHRAAERAVGP
jgi:hypothetical protein